MSEAQEIGLGGQGKAAPSVDVAAAQMQSQDNLAENLTCAGELIQQAKRRGASLVVLPENFAYMGNEDEKRAIAEPIGARRDDGPILAALRRFAEQSHVYLIGGGMPERSDDPSRPFNTSVLVSPAGEIVASYRKIHLFDVEVGDGASYHESKATSPGDRAVVADVGGVAVGMSVCYDVRFPELYRKLADKGAVLATVPAAFTLMTGKDHWHVLLRARAIESQLVVVAAAQCGIHPKGRRTYGKSCIIDPWGDVLAQAPDGVGIVSTSIDLERALRVRKSLPSLTHRRPFE
ncbi:MAG: carbon-nitrogen hydrolase family protein [Myxococcales bacterium]|nr:carbon-nitrogen hydrolase family protein [Myxococcales bacterium]